MNCFNDLFYIYSEKGNIYFYFLGKRFVFNKQAYLMKKLLLLISKNKNKKALNLLKFIENKYGFNSIKNYLYIANFAYNAGYKKDKFEKAYFVYNALKRNENEQKVEKYFQNKTIAIVGNSGCELGKNRKNEIDSHNVVIRFNNYPSGYEKDYGQKTSVWVRCSADEINDLRDLSQYDMVIWGYFDLENKPLKFNHLDILYRDLKLYPSKINYIPKRYDLLTKNKLGVIPTMGAIMLCMINDIQKNLKNVDVYGFSFLSDKKDSSHYYDDKCRIEKDHLEFSKEQKALRDLLKRQKG